MTCIAFLSVVRGLGSSARRYLGGWLSLVLSSTSDTSRRVPASVSRYSVCCLRRTLVHIYEFVCCAIQVQYLGSSV
jgi:hypothetical protein